MTSVCKPGWRHCCRCASDGRGQLPGGGEWRHHPVVIWRQRVHPSDVIVAGVRVTAVDNYQGEENDVIILSLVRNNVEGSVGFLRTNNRVCVALSRARNGFYAFGNFRSGQLLLSVFPPHHLVIELFIYWRLRAQSTIIKCATKSQSRINKKLGSSLTNVFKLKAEFKATHKPTAMPSLKSNSLKYCPRYFTIELQV